MSLLKKISNRSKIIIAGILLIIVVLFIVLFNYNSKLNKIYRTIKEDNVEYKINEVIVNNNTKYLQIWMLLYPGDLEPGEDENAGYNMAVKLKELRKEKWFDYNYVYIDTWIDSVGRYSTITFNVDTLEHEYHEWE